MESNRVFSFSKFVKKSINGFGAIKTALSILFQQKVSYIKKYWFNWLFQMTSTFDSILKAYPNQFKLLWLQKILEPLPTFRPNTTKN